MAGLVGGEEGGKQGHALVCVDPAQTEKVGRPGGSRTTGDAVGVVHPEPDQQLAMGGHGEGALHQVALGCRLEDEPVGGGEHRREDGQVQGGLVVGGRMQDGRCRYPVDGPHRGVVEVRIEDDRIGIGPGRGLGQRRYHGPLEVDPAFGVGP